MMNQWRSAAVVALVAAVVVAGGGRADAGIYAKCQAGKLKCSTGLATGLLGCLGKDNTKPDLAPGSPVLQACIAKVVAKYTGGTAPEKGCFAKLEAKPPCANPGDSDFIQNMIANYVDADRLLLDPSAPPSTLSKCIAGQQKCVANLVKALLGCEGKQVAVPNSTALSACVQKAVDKFTGGADPTKACFAKAEKSGGCGVAGQSASVLANAQAFHAQVASALGCGDGVVGTGETCDDGNHTACDGCSATCQAESPAVCGNGSVECGETCDDGNTTNFDICPSTCVEQACTPTATPVTATVTWNAPASVAGMTVVVDYPEGKVKVPGIGSTIAPGTFTGYPSGTSHAENILGTTGYAARVVVSKATAITPRPGTLFVVHTTTCQEAPAAVSGDFTCTVESAFAPDGVTPVAATCSVSVP